MCASVSPPVGPTWVPTVFCKTQGIAPDPVGSAATAIARAHTLLLSWESCQVARTTLKSSGSGLGLLKWVMS